VANSTVVLPSFSLESSSLMVGEEVGGEVGEVVGASGACFGLV